MEKIPNDIVYIALLINVDEPVWTSSLLLLLVEALSGLPEGLAELEGQVLESLGSVTTSSSWNVKISSPNKKMIQKAVKPSAHPRQS